jgi:hypothetical protein
MIAISTYDLNMYPFNKIGLMVDMGYLRVRLADVQRRYEDIRIGRDVQNLETVGRGCSYTLQN